MRDIIKRLMGQQEKEPEFSQEPMLDIGVAVDHQRRVYQIQLYSTPFPDITVPFIAAPLPPQRLEHVLREIQSLAVQGYVPTMDYLPCETEKLMEKWR